MLVLSDSSPLIYLAKLGRLDLLRIVYKIVVIPEAVLIELRGGVEYPELAVIEQAIKQNWIITKKTEIQFRLEGLGKGELALISLAQETKPGLILVDDASARKVMESFGFNVKGTLYVLLLACKKKLIAKDETKRLLDELIVAGFRVSTEIYSRIMKELE